MADQKIGRYEIQREIGRGAMGIVYAATDPVMHREVALKTMSIPAALPPENRRALIERFYREARALAKLSHPNVVSVHDMGQAEGECFLVMELLRGASLRDRLRYHGALPVAEVRRVGIAACQALDHVHSQGIVHRDVKPDNLMLMPDGVVKLTDFGIARIGDQVGLTQTGSMMGSPAYMAPEQVLGQPIDHRIDLFALGSTLYEAFTGQRAFDGESVAAITHRVAYDEPYYPPAMPAALKAALRRALAKDPDRRYQSAAEMADDLALVRDRLAAAEPTPASGTRPSPRPNPTPTPAAPPEATPTPGARCVNHPAATAIAACAECAAPICYHCAIAQEGRGLLCPEHAELSVGIVTRGGDTGDDYAGVDRPSARALAAMWLGVASMVTFPLGAVVPLAAAAAGLLELRSIARDEAALAGEKLAWAGVVLGAAGIVGFVMLMLRATA